MIIWINGAFGVGKTQSSYELHRRIPNSFIYDPENIGLFIRKNIPKELNSGDFQNYSMWREFNFSMLKYIANKYKGIIIVPMTISNPQYFKEIIVQLRNDGFLINHFVLCASKETVLKRLRGRGEGGNSWAAQQIDSCIKGFSNEIFKQHIDTEDLSIQGVVEKIALLSNINLLPDNRRKIRKCYDRIITQFKNVRL
ncbi:AAA family ATPase [Clostridium tagluense]|uniref:Tunicamycin resistance protein n=1 Tax=Clostridium tagluense TaxID=360422 RepID=A0A401ULW9_9CLOT|nr:AAA family ATPase [Clostridium tagluense]GCD10524.1 tunicamycin resistance protein [Clostridium tagluense]